MEHILVNFPVSRTVLIDGEEVTTFKLSAESVDRLRAVGAKLLTASPDYQKLLKDLK